MAKTRLPPGFRFHPTDEELLKYYLKRKVMGKKIQYIGELNIYKFSPWDLPDKSTMNSKDREWFFFCPRERKYAVGSRMSRKTEAGYWKTTGKDRPVVYNKQTVGMIKTLVFHLGQAPHGERTDWVMYEYRIDDKDLADAGVVQDAYVLCKIFKKCGPGPKNGAQYGAPFNEEEWDDDEEEDGLTLPALPLTSNNQNGSVTTSFLNPESICSGLLSEPGPSNTLPGADELLPIVRDGDDIDSMLDNFVEDASLLQTDNNDIVVVDDNLFQHDEDKSNNEFVVQQGPLCLDGGNEIYNGLGDLINCPQIAAASAGDDNGFGLFSTNNNNNYYNDYADVSAGLNYYTPPSAGGGLSYYTLPTTVEGLELKDLDCPLNGSSSFSSQCFPAGGSVLSNYYGKEEPNFMNHNLSPPPPPLVNHNSSCYYYGSSSLPHQQQIVSGSNLWYHPTFTPTLQGGSNIQYYGGGPEHFLQLFNNGNNEAGGQNAKNS